MRVALTGVIVNAVPGRHYSGRVWIPRFVLPAVRDSRFPIPDVSDEVIVLRKYSSEVEATMAHLVLEAHNIPSAVMRDNAGGMIPSMALLYPVRLAVRREDADEARRILDAEAPLPAEDGGEEVIDDAENLGTSWSPEHDREDDQFDEPEDSESDRRW